jgi:hypothetical protein
VRCATDVGFAAWGVTEAQRDPLACLSPEATRPTFSPAQEQTAPRLGSLAGFRNIPLQDCVRLDRKLVYELLRTKLNNLRGFGRDVAQFRTGCAGA